MVLGVHLAAPDAELVRQRARQADRSVSAELRRALRASGYLPAHDDEQDVGHDDRQP